MKGMLAQNGHIKVTTELDSGYQLTLEAPAGVRHMDRDSAGAAVHDQRVVGASGCGGARPGAPRSNDTFSTPIRERGSEVTSRCRVQIRARTSGPETSTRTTIRVLLCSAPLGQLRSSARGEPQPERRRRKSGEVLCGMAVYGVPGSF